MPEMDPHNTIPTSAPRLGEIGRAVARSIKGIVPQTSQPSFANTLASASQAQAQTQAQAQAYGQAQQAVPGQQQASPYQPAVPYPPVAAAQTATGLPPAQPMMVASAQAGAAPAAPEVTGSGTRVDPFIVPYGSVPAGVTATSMQGVATSAVTSASVTGASAVASAPAIKPLELKEYPKPEKSDRSGVLSWAPNSPPSSRDVDRFVAEARSRRAGWATFEVDPARYLEYDELVERLTEAGIQPIVRVQDPYGEVPPAEIEAMVKDLSAQGVHYFQLFDGANVASQTPDDRVDVDEYAGRWLAAAQAVVAGGGLPGLGALSPNADFDDLGYMRKLLSEIKDRGGADVLGQSWMALRAETPGATATSGDTEALGHRAEWYDRLSRRALGRSLPILTTLDPDGRTERLPAAPSSTKPTDFADQSERAIKDLRRKLPSLFGAVRGTVESARP